MSPPEKESPPQAATGAGSIKDHQREGQSKYSSPAAVSKGAALSNGVAQAASAASAIIIRPAWPSNTRLMLIECGALVLNEDGAEVENDAAWEKDNDAAECVNTCKRDARVPQYTCDGFDAPGGNGDDPSADDAAFGNGHGLSLGEAALAYAQRGWRIVPLHNVRVDGSCSCGKPDCKSVGKHPRTQHGQKNATADAPKIKEWWGKWPDANIGVYCEPSGICVVDVDPRNGGDETLMALEQEHGALTSCLMSDTGGGGKHIFFAAPSNGAKLSGKLGKGIDFKHNGYVVLPPSNHQSGAKYRWANGGLLDAANGLDPLPGWIVNGGSSKPSGKPQTDDDHDATDIDHDEFHAALFAIPNDERIEYDDWIKIGAAIHHQVNGSEEGFALFDRWSSQNQAKYDYETTRAKWNSFGAYNGEPVTALTIFKMAREHGWRPLYELGDHIMGDVTLARQFAKEHSHAFRYVSQDKNWLRWDGLRWNPHLADDEAFLAIQDFIAKKLNEASAALRAANAAGDEGAIKDAKGAFATICAYHKDARKIKTLVSIVPRQRGIFTSALEYDRDPWLMGVENGVVDLRTGELLAPNQKFNVTKLAGCSYDPNAACPRFMKFLERVLPEADVLEFMQRRSGYTLTGSVDEEKLFFDHGAGANGKSVFVNITKVVMGDYAVSIAAETLMNQKNDNEFRRDLTKLVGARLALANETPMGTIWSDARVKLLSSREEIPARKLYKEGFDFPPTHALWVRGNNIPGVKDASDGFWRRMISTKWGVNIPEAERVVDLDKRIIEEEKEGVLAWMVQGALKWRKDGLKIPQSVTEECAEYRKDTDVVGRWIEESLGEKLGAKTLTAALHHDFEIFCGNMGIHPMSEFAFGRTMAARGYKKCKIHGKRGFEDVEIASPNVRVM